MGSQPASAEARGRVRLLLAELLARSDAMAAAVRSLPPVMVRAATSGPTVGRTAAVGRIIARLPARPIISDRRSACWRLLTPIGEDGVLAEALLLGAPTYKPLEIVPFGIAWSWHSLRRVVDRGGRGADPLGEMVASHDRLLQLRSADGAEVYGRTEVLLPTRLGAFVCRPGRLRIGTSPLITATTWICIDQAFADQELQLRAWPGSSAA